jgi:membrane protease YdiL (CAAX protease family)
MTAPSAEAKSSSIVAFRDAQWRSRWLVIGLAVLLVWRGVSFVDREWLSQFPYWLLLIITGLVPQAFLLIFPIITRNPNRRSSFGVPSPTHCLIELGIAIPVVIGTIVILTAVDYLVDYLSPGTSLTPDAFSNLARSLNHIFVCLLLLFAFTFVPVAEEVFFRGFLYNAFRARMPLLVAGLVQSLIFGFGHFFGLMHAGVAFVIGLLLTMIYEWRKTLITPILVHAGISFVAALGTVLMMAVHANGPVMGVYCNPNEDQCVIRQITPGSAAEEAGLQVGDIITSLNSVPIRNFSHLVQTISHYRPGDAVPASINRSGNILEVTVILRRRGDP